jgi:KaiC/GvpD/RAD55 family RecA-like ATPase
VSELDRLLGGGLLPGTLTVIMGASGIGKTQLGLAFANEGHTQEHERGVVFDLTSRGDSQNHHDYARRLFDWDLREHPLTDRIALDRIWNREATRRDYLHLFDRSGRRVTVSDMDQEQWRQWQQEQTRKLDHAIAFFYGNFIHGSRRCVIDGVEPTDRASDSIQFDCFEYIYHQILRKDHDWVARDLFRVHFRQNAETIHRHAYRQDSISCVLLYTSHEVMLDDLLTRRIESGDVLSNANTVILMGKTRSGNQIGRALHIAKHRGSVCDGSIVPFGITDRGLEIGSGL